MTLSLQLTLSLKVGDQIWVIILYATNAKLADNSNNYIHFTGHLLQEDISLKLNDSVA